MICSYDCYFPRKISKQCKAKYTNILPHKMTFYVSFTVKYLSTEIYFQLKVQDSCSTWNMNYHTKLCNIFKGKNMHSFIALFSKMIFKIFCSYGNHLKFKFSMHNISSNFDLTQMNVAIVRADMIFSPINRMALLLVVLPFYNIHEYVYDFFLQKSYITEIIGAIFMSN